MQEFFTDLAGVYFLIAVIACFCQSDDLSAELVFVKSIAWPKMIYDYCRGKKP